MKTYTNQQLATYFLAITAPGSGERLAHVPSKVRLAFAKALRGCETNICDAFDQGQNLTELEPFGDPKFANARKLLVRLIEEGYDKLSNERLAQTLSKLEAPRTHKAKRNRSDDFGAGPGSEGAIARHER